MSTLRVISGTAKGLRLASVPGESTRPITDRVKESVFNIIGNDVKDSNWLDLFGGTGAVSIEALSRGANSATIIEINQTAVNIINKNLQYTNLFKRSKVIKADSFTFLNTSLIKPHQYIYVAPPQYKEFWEKSMRVLDDKSGWLSDDGWIIVQIHPVEYKKLNLINFTEFDQRKYGSTLCVFFEKLPGE